MIVPAIQRPTATVEARNKIFFILFHLLSFLPAVGRLDFRPKFLEIILLSSFLPPLSAFQIEDCRFQIFSFLFWRIEFNLKSQI